MSLMNLPRDLLLIIMGYLDIIYDDQPQPAACIFLTVSKRFQWLKEYRVAHVQGDEYRMKCEYLNMMGEVDGPVYYFNSSDRSFAGCCFVTEGRIIGEYVREVILPNRCLIIHNGTVYDHTDDRNFPHHDIGAYHGCLCSYCVTMMELYEKLSKIDIATFAWIKSISDDVYEPTVGYYLVRHIDTLKYLREMKILVDGRNLIKTEFCVDNSYSSYPTMNVK